MPVLSGARYYWISVYLTRLPKLDVSMGSKIHCPKQSPDSRGRFPVLHCPGEHGYRCDVLCPAAGVCVLFPLREGDFTPSQDGSVKQEARMCMWVKLDRGPRQGKEESGPLWAGSDSETWP